MDLAVALKYPFADKNWIVKSLILLACCITVVLLPAVLGYQMAAARRGAADPEASLPEWNDFGTLYMDGLRLLVVQFLYMLPGLLCAGGGFLALALFCGDDRAAGVGLVLCILGCGVGFILTIAGAFLALVAYLCLMATPGSIAGGLDLPKVFGLLAGNIKDVLVFVVYGFIVGLIGSAINGITVGFGSIVVTPLTTLICACLYGQLYRLVMARQYD